MEDPNLETLDDEENGEVIDTHNSARRIDADSILEPDALLRATRPFLEDERMIAVGGIVRVVNGSTVDHGRVRHVRLSRSLLARLQGQLQGVGEDISDYIQISIERTYEDFITKVAGYREREPEEIDAVAQGRVWIGVDAADRGLVDNLGGLREAIESAAGLAGLEPNSYSIDELNPELGWAERLALEMVSVGAPVFSALGVETILPESLERILAVASEPLAFYEEFNDPRGVYAYCFCDLR